MSAWRRVGTEALEPLAERMGFRMDIEDETNGTSAEPGMFARRLDHLFNTIYPRSLGRPYTAREVTDAINAKAGRTVISHSYLWQLRTGRKTDPSHSRLAAIADFFEVKAEYFFDEELAQRTDADLEAIAMLRDAGVRRVAKRLLDVSEGNLDFFAEMAAKIRQMEGLPPVDDPPPGASGQVSGGQSHVPQS